MRNRCFAVSLLVLAGLAGITSAAYRVEPAMVVIKVSRGESMAWVDVVHSGGGPIAVELTALNRVLDINGENVTSGLPPATEFVVHPAQIILQPKERARVQVLYKGKGRVTADKAFYLFSKEIPLELEKEIPDDVQTSVTTLVSYYTVIALETDRPGRLTYVSSKVIGDGTVEVIVENKSSGRVRTDNLVINIGKDKIHDFTGKKNSVMPGQQRRFTFKYNRAVTAREISFTHN